MFIVLPRFRLRISVFALPLVLLMLWCEGVLPFSVLMLSAAFHEAGHIFALRYLGYRIRRMDILPMGALIVCPEGIPYHDEYKIALSGPLASLIFALVASILISLTGGTIWFFCLLINLVLGLFNLMPIKKLDGGKALCCFILAKQKNAEPLCSAISILFKFLFLVLLGLAVACSEFNIGVLLLSLALIFQLFPEK